MRIVRFGISKAHGYLTVGVDFNNDLTFLTGINGSGKTTIVRGLIALLTPSFTSLASLAFEEMSLTVEFEGKEYAISARRVDETVVLSVSGISDPFVMPIYKQAEYEPYSKFSDREAEYYRELHTTSSRHSVLEWLNRLPTPMFLDLERRSQGPIRRRRFFVPGEDRTFEGGSLVSRNTGGLADAIELSQEAFRACQSDLNNQTNRLRTRLILTAFEPLSFETRASVSSPSYFDEQKVAEQRRLVVSTLRDLRIEEGALDNTVLKFFDDLSTLLERMKYRDLGDLLKTKEGVEQVGQWMSVQPQLRQINKIIELVNQSNERIAAIRAPIDAFLNSINRFLSDSGKSIEFRTNGRLAVRIAGKQNVSLSGLSSGERQLVVILSHLAFNENAKIANVLIIDEPELSLHVKWQESFVSALLNASSNTQMILATHSPSIILDRTEKCIDVRAQ